MLDKLEEELNEIQTLKSSLSALSSLSSQSTLLLTQFDTRLASLEASILPIHIATQKQSTVYENMNSTIDQLSIFIRLLETPDIKLVRENIGAFYTELDSQREAYLTLLHAKVRGIERVLEAKRSLISSSLQRLESHFKRSLLELSEDKSKDEEKIEKVKATAGVLSRYENDTEIAPCTSYMKIIVEVRSAHLMKIVNEYKQTSEDIYVKNSSILIKFIVFMAEFVKYEWTFINELIPMNTLQVSKSSKQKIIDSVYEQIITQPFEWLFSQFEQLLQRVRRSQVSLKYGAAFELYDCLSVIVKEHGEWIETLSHAVKIKTQLHALYNEVVATSLKMLEYEFHSVKLPDDAIVHEMSSNTVAYLRRIMEFDVVDLVLRVRDSSDLFGAIVGVARVKRQNEYLNKYCIDILTNLTSTLEQKAKGYKNKYVASLFLLNNLFYVQKQVRMYNLPGIDLDKRIKEESNSFQSIINPLLTMLMDDNNKDSKKLKEKFKGFNEGLDEVLSQLKKVSVPDGDLKEKLVKEMKVIVPLYTRFFEKYANTDFTKNKDKYIKYDPGSLETVIGGLFE